MFVERCCEHSLLVFVCLERSGSTTVRKGISIPVIIFVFIWQETKLVFGDRVVLCFEVERVRGFLSEKFEDKESTRTVACFWLLCCIGNSSGVKGIKFIFEEQ